MFDLVFSNGSEEVGLVVRAWGCPTTNVSLASCDDQHFPGRHSWASTNTMMHIIFC